MGPRKRKAADLPLPERSSERRAVQESLKVNFNETVKKMNLGVVAAAADGKDNGKMGKGSRGKKPAKPPKEKKSAQTVARKRPKKEPPTRKNEDLDVETGAESPDIIAAPVVSSQGRPQPARRGRPPLASGESKREKVRKVESQREMKSSKRKEKPMKKAALKRKKMPKKADLDGPPKLAVENATSRLPELIDDFRIPDNQSQASDDTSDGLPDLRDETPPDLGEPQNSNNPFLENSREPSPTPPPLNEPLPSTSRGFVQQPSGYSADFDADDFGSGLNPGTHIPKNPPIFIPAEDNEDMLVTVAKDKVVAGRNPPVQPALVPTSVSKQEVIRTQPLKLLNSNLWDIERMQYTIQDVIYNDRGNCNFMVLLDRSNAPDAPADILTFKVYHLLRRIDMLAPLPEVMETDDNYGEKCFYALFAQVILEAPEAEEPSTSTFQIMHEAIAANAGVDIELLKICMNEAIRVFSN